MTDTPSDTDQTPATTPAAPTISFADATARQDTYTLQFPLIVNGETLNYLTLTRLTADQVRQLQDQVGDAADDKIVDDEITAFMTGQPIEVIRHLDAEDRDELATMVASFLPAFMTGGASPTPDPSSSSSQENAAAD